jgi:hypothetical protein
MDIILDNSRLIGPLCLRFYNLIGDFTVRHQLSCQAACFSLEINITPQGLGYKASTASITLLC